MSKISYLDETLKRLPIILVGCSGLWYGITKLNDIESKIEKIELLSFKDKEVIDSKVGEPPKLVSDKCALCNISSIGQTVYSFNAVLSNTLNWNTLTYPRQKNYVY